VAVAPQVGTATADSVFGHLNEVANDPADSRQIWDNVSTQFGSRGSDGTANGLSSNVTQEAIGVDLLAQGATRFGIGYAFGSTDVRSDGGSGSSQENAAFVYGQLAAGRYLLNGIVSYGATSSNTQRAAPLGDTVLRTNGVGGGDALGAIGLSRPFILQDITLAPYGRVTVQQVSQNSATEGTASITALSIDSFAGTGVRGVLGVTGGSNAASPLAAPYTYQFDAGVGEDAGNLVNPSLHATLVGVGLSIAAPRVSSTFAQLSVAGTVRFNNSAYAYANLFGEARGNATLAGITGGLRVTF
jgi:fibronectin-binding autotransporter adhesin